ncbi:MAG: hypothetical protein WC135_02810 [Bacteroidales bacterium]
MKRTITLLAFFFALITASNLFAQDVFQDVLYLKNGEIRKGKVLETNDDYILFSIQDVTYKVIAKDIDAIKQEKVEHPEYPELPKLTEQVNSSSSKVTTPYRDPFLSTILSYFIPGAGQIYNHQVGKGAGFIIWGVASQTLMLTSLIMQPLRSSEIYQRNWTIAAGLSAVSYLTCWIYSMYDANKTSKKINSEGLYSMNLGNNKTLSISPDLSLVNDYSKPNTSSSQASYGMKIKLAF